MNAGYDEVTESTYNKRIKEIIKVFERLPNSTDITISNQAKFVTKMLDANFLNSDEMDVFKRARNYRSTSHPKSCDIITYKFATGLEAIIGYLDFENKKERINEIMKFILGEDVC